VAEGEFEQIMKRKLSALSGQYLAALREHLEQGPQASLEPARGLGRQAVAIGLETLEMARIHEGAIATLGASGSTDGMIARAAVFFNEAITPIERTHGAALKANAHLDEVNKTLDRRTVDLAASHRSLKRSIIRRKTVEGALKKSGGRSETLLEESHRLQKHLRRLAHQILTAQEAKREKTSRDLQDEIAQTLLGINVRLLTLKKEAAVGAQGFKKEIANTQRLVDKSVESIKRFAREFGKRQAA
jgi:signal transduction histidine kinase